jgi:formate-dependent nitrite reductase membrane component NrfD
MWTCDLVDVYHQICVALFVLGSSSRLVVWRSGRERDLPMSKRLYTFLGTFAYNLLLVFLERHLTREIIGVVL